MTNLSVFDTVSSSNQGAKLHLKHPLTDEPVYSDDDKTKPITIRLKGQDSDVYQTASRKKLIELRKAKEENEEIDESTFDKTDAENIELFASMTVGWENIYHDGKELKFSKKNAVMLYDNYLEIKNQVAKFIGKKANFIKG